MIFDKGIKVNQWQKDSHFNKFSWNNDIYLQKKEKGDKEGKQREREKNRKERKKEEDIISIYS